MNGFELIAQVLLRPESYTVLVWFLVWVFIWSGFAKLRHPGYPAMAMVHFGIIRHFRPALGQILGLGEIALAFGLVFMPHLAIIIATPMLWLFVFLLARSLQSGEQFACGCFGDPNERISPTSLLRTTALATLASLLLFLSLSSVSGTNNLSILAAIVGLAVLGSFVLVGAVSHLIATENRVTKKSFGAAVKGNKE